MGMNPRLSVLVLVLLTAFASAACSKGEAPPGTRGGSGAGTPSVVPADPALKTAPASARDLAVTVDLAITTDTVDDSVTAIRKEVETEGGYLMQANVAGDDGERSAHLEARIPKDQLASLRPVAHGLGDVTSDVETVEDVTEARADVKARLHAARVEEARLLDLMKDHTGKLSEVLEAEKELARIRENIERIEAEERTMDGRVTYATVRIQVTQRSTPVWHTPGKSIVIAGRAGLHAAAAILVGVGMAVAATSPTLVPILLFAWALVAVYRWRARRRLENAAR